MSTITICKRSTVRFDFPGCGFIECDPIEMNGECERLREENGEVDFIRVLSNYLGTQQIRDDSGVISDRCPDLGQTLEFQNAIVGIVNDITEARKKKVAQIVSSLGSTQESPTTTENGTTTQNEHGLNVTVTSKPESCSLPEHSMT